MKGIKKGLAMLFAIVIAASVVAGCGPKEHPQTEFDITIQYWRSGLGQDFLDRAIAGFEDKYPQYKVWLDPTSSISAAGQTFGKGVEIDKVDLYMSSSDEISLKVFEEHAEPLDDVLSYTNSGETKSIGQKYIPAYLDAARLSDNSVHYLSYGGGWMGIVYNMDIIDGKKYKVPRTTQELEYLTIDLAGDEKLQSSGVKPWIHFNGGGYWGSVYKAWQAQYDSLDYYMNNFIPLYGGESDPAPSKSVLLKDDGRKAVLEAMDRFLNASYIHPDSNTQVFMDAQTFFVYNKAAMMVNGSWMINEMRGDSKANKNFKIMKNPVISSIIENDECSSIEDDEELQALIDAVDAASSAAQVPIDSDNYHVSREAVNRVFEARNIMYNNYDQHGMFIPNYAVAKEGAKEFLKYFYSDENLIQYWDATRMPMPLTLSDDSKPDMTGWNAWEIQQMEYMNSVIPLFERPVKTSKIFTTGGANPYAFAHVPFINLFTAQSNRQGAQTCWSRIKNHHDANWINYRTNAQL